MRNLFITKIFRSLLLFHIFLSLLIPVHSNIIQSDDSLIDEHRTFKSEEITRGERLFYGLVYTQNKSINCASCHNTRVSDTLNWNPDAIEISKIYLNKSSKDLSKVLINPSGKKMAEVHKDFDFSSEDIMLIKAYMDILPGIGLRPEKPAITKLILFIFAIILLGFSITDLIITKKLKKQWIHYFILILTGIFITHTLVVDALAIGHSPNYSPDQPIKFSHAVHAGQNATDCNYCHSSAQFSKVAGIPSENVCMNCHLVVRNGKRSGSFEIAKLINAYESKLPVEWIKVYNLPDHVFFSHAQHVKAGGITCQECHGAVEKTDVISLNTPLTMGWCINCHRSRKVDFQNNKFYTDYSDLKHKMQNKEIDSVTVEMVGGTDCMKCHY